MLEEDNCFRVLGWFDDSCIASSLNQADLANPGLMLLRNNKSFIQSSFEYPRTTTKDMTSCTHSDCIIDSNNSSLL